MSAGEPPSVLTLLLLLLLLFKQRRDRRRSWQGDWPIAGNRPGLGFLIEVSTRVSRLLPERCSQAGISGQMLRVQLLLLLQLQLVLLQLLLV